MTKSGAEAPPFVEVLRVSGGNFYRPITGRLSEPIRRQTIWCRLATDRRCWFFTLSKNEPAPKTVNSFTFTTQSGRGKFNDIPFGQIVATFIPCGGLPNLPLAVYTPRNKI